MSVLAQILTGTHYTAGDIFQLCEKQGDMDHTEKA